MTLELIFPVYNEEAVLGALTERIEQVFAKSNVAPLGITDVLVTFMDNCSTDSSVEIIRKYIKVSSFKCRVIKLSRNFGHQNSVSAGFHYSKGDHVAVLDADLQDPPEVVLEMYKEMKQGYDIIYGVRKKRKESWVKKLSYWLFYRAYRFMSSIQVPLDAGDFCLMSRRAVDAFNSLGESIRFPRGIRAWIGYNQKGFEYERAARAEGESKYSIRDLFGLAIDGITAFSIRPLRLTQYLATFYFLCSMLFTGYFIFRFFNPVFLQKDTLVVLASMSVSNMFVMVILHIHGAYLGRTYLESKQRPIFLVEEITSNEI